MRFCSIGSGSSGNAHLIESGEVTVMIDCGFSYRTMKKRLAQRDIISPAEIDHLFISHEHNDHIAGLATFLDRNKPALYMTAGTAQVLRGRGLELPAAMRYLTPGVAVHIADMLIMPVTVPHDVEQPVQFTVECGGRKLALFSDLGHVTPAVLDACYGADVLMVECNYNEKMLARSPYPEVVKERIAGRYGHLSNRAAAALIEKTRHPRRRYVLAAHLSANNNTAECVRQDLAEHCGEEVTIITQDAGIDWITV